MTIELIKKRRIVRRIIELSIVIAFLSLAIVLTIIRYNNGTVIESGTPLLPNEVVYPNNYLGLIMASYAISVYTLLVFICDVIFARIYNLEVDGEEVIIYANPLVWKLVVNGEIVDSTFCKTFLEAKLKSGIILTASRRIIMSFHLTFSDGRNPIDF